mmetsp:Transcript_73873/g.196719  ORF Transcript_73873/g.196719 Transcript_73873/m.196719 type:complete len:631 (+) Transcript_73873:521-2413(+)
MLLKLPVSCSQRLVACCLMPKMRSLFYRMFPAVDASIWAAAEASGFALCFAMEDDHIRRLLPSCSTLCTGITQTGAVFVFRRIEANSRELLFPEAHATNGRGFSNLDQSFVLPPPGSDGIITISISQVPDASSAIAAGLPVACRQTRTSCSAGPGRNPPSELRTNESADIGLRVVRTGARVLDSASLFYLSASLSAAWSSQPPGAGTSAAGACKRGSLRALAIEGGLPVTGSITGLEALGGAIVAGRLQLRSLSLSGGGLGVEGARVFCREAIRALKGERAELATSPWALQRLDLSGNRLESTGLSLIAAALGFDASPHCSGDPSNGQATGDSSLGGVSPPPQLHALNLCGNNLGSGVGDALRAFDCVRTRDVLDPGCHSANEKLSRVVVGIEFLDLSSNDLESQFATDLASSLVHYFPTLKVLVLDGNPLGPSGAETLADSLFKLVDLRELSLVGCWLGDEGAMEVSIGAPNCQRLTRLDLTSNGLTCAAAESFGEALAEFKRLQQLRLSRNGIMGPGCCALFASAVSFCLAPRAPRDEADRVVDELWLACGGREENRMLRWFSVSDDDWCSDMFCGQRETVEVDQPKRTMLGGHSVSSDAMRKSGRDLQLLLEDNIVRQFDFRSPPPK